MYGEDSEGGYGNGGGSDRGYRKSSGPRRFGSSGGSSYGGGSGGGYGGPQRIVPVKVGEEFEATIEAIAAKGDGIAKKEGFVIFVPGTQVGDKVKIRVTKVMRKVAFAEKADGSAPSSEEPAGDSGFSDGQSAESGSETAEGSSEGSSEDNFEEEESSGSASEDEEQN